MSASSYPKVSEPSFWEQIVPGSVITLKDRQTLEDSMKRNLGPKPIDYIVSKVRRIVEQNGLAAWTLCLLEDPSQQIWFVAKSVGDRAEFSVYYEPSEFQPGDRKDMLDAGNFWLFCEPSDVKNFVPSDLQFTDEIDQNLESGTVAYIRKGQGTLYGEMASNPPEAEGEIFAAVVEYSAKDAASCEDPELLLLELGGEDGENGGLISLMLGTHISTTDFDVIKK